jgi:pimeloyl-[acyl-carrier protein] synthase
MSTTPAIPVTVDVLTRLREPDCLADPYPLYESIRQQHQTCTPAGDAVFSRYQDVVAVLSDERFVKPPLPRAPLKAARVLFRMFLLLNPPDHTRLRRVVAPSFTASAIERLRPKITAIANDLLPSDACTIELIGDFAYPLPLAVVAEILGIPDDDRPAISAWSATLTTSLDEPPPTRLRELPRTISAVVKRNSHPIAAARAANRMVRYAKGQITNADTAPPSEFLETLARGVRDRALDADEAAATWIMMAIAGHETTANLIGNSVVALLKHPEALQQVRSDPELARSAVEESLRYDGPVPYTPRAATEDVCLNGTEVAQGAQALLLMAAANHDPAAFPRPEDFELARPDTPPHLGSATASTSASAPRLRDSKVKSRSPRYSPASPPSRTLLAWYSD